MYGDQTGGLSAQKAKHEEAPFDWLPSNAPDRSRLDRVLSDVLVAMRDGTRLATDVYLPEGDGPFPVVLTRMPYGKAEPYCAMPAIAEYWARMGYAAVVQDVRGKWGSEGVFEPNKNGNEISDGYDTVDWIAGQDWCNGRVGMWGESYFGFTSFAGATSGHPNLMCIAPGDISLDRYWATYRYGCLQLNTVGTWSISMTDQTYQDLSRLDYWHLPLADMASAAGAPSAYFDQVVANPVRGPFWEERSLLAGYDAIRIPVLHWGGWYDNYLGPVIRDWRKMRANNAPSRHNHLLIGPWDHEGTADRLHRVGLLPVREGTLADRWDFYREFFDHYLMGYAGAGAPPAVRYFVMGADVWRTAESWPPTETLPTPFYLHSAGHANTLSGDGRLSREAPTGDEPVDRFVYDPANPVADTLDLDCWALAGQMSDRQSVELRDDVLVYDTDPLADGLELTGPVSATLHAASSAPDTDFTMTLVDVFPDGRANMIQDGILRASYRDDVDHPSPIEPGHVYAFTLDLWATSYVVKRGHQLRVEVSSSCFNRYDRNLNTGEPFGRGARPVTATQTIHHDGARPSHVLLPLRRS